MSPAGWALVFVVPGVLLLAGVVYVTWFRMSMHPVRQQQKPPEGKRTEKQNDEYWQELARRRAEESAVALAAWKADPTPENLERRRSADAAETEAIGNANAASEDHFGIAGVFRDE